MFPRTGVRLTDTIRIRGAWARLCHMMVFGRVRLPSEEEFEDPGTGRCMDFLGDAVWRGRAAGV